MPLPLHECWHCGKSRLELSEKVRAALWEANIAFHCSAACNKKCKITNYKPKGDAWSKKELDDEQKEFEEKNKVEKKPASNRQCGRCKKFGTGHNARTCKEIIDGTD